MRKPDLDPLAVEHLVRRTLPGSWEIQRTGSGRSTHVYRLTRRARVLYLRLAEDRAASLAPELLVLRLLRERGVKVPEVVHFEAFDDVLERSAMITTAIEGRPLAASSSRARLASVLRRAGRDLAIVNSVSVEGFGWVRRDRPALEAAYETHAAFVASEVLPHLEAVEPLLGSGVVSALRKELESFGGVEPRLAHGDFDASHIFQRDGGYSGLIDFGEIRGAHPLYDLGHFLLHERELTERPVLRFLLEGYGDVSPLPDDHGEAIRTLSLLVAVPALARRLERPPSAYRRFLVAAIRRSVQSETSRPLA